jgi:hypothetical protein
MSIPVKDKDGNVVAWAHEIDDDGVVHRPPFESNPSRFKDLHTPPHFRYPSTMDELMEFATEFFERCKKIAEARNRRYAGPYDPFKNFRLGGDYGVAIRMSDKVSRLLTLLHPSNTTDEDGESIEDTCVDLANYAMLLSGMRANERGTE